eukprot:m.192021 g.192021  ORF g.192021 m.192021 type:complete len:169 (-) comp25728_c0_seq10:441-947(-)
MIELYDDLSQKIPREEVAAFGDIIRDIVKALGIHTRVEIGGGYRRGKLFSSDIDILIEAPDEDFEERNLERIISKLKEQKIMTHSLRHLDGVTRYYKTVPRRDSTTTVTHSGNMPVFFGICRLPKPGSLHRRVDLVMVPKNEWVFCLFVYLSLSVCVWIAEIVNARDP